jgi:DNA replication and repair protein RecF
VQLDHLWLTDFRNYGSADLVLAAEGFTVVTGGNGEGKTNLLEAIGWLGTLSSFRGAPSEALVRTGATAAVIRAEGRRDGRHLLIESELFPAGRSRVQINRQLLRRSRDVLGAVRVTVFTPDDLALVKGAAGERRGYLDELLMALHPRWHELRRDFERILRHRGTLLKQAAGRLTAEVGLTLDVWDSKLATVGNDLAEARAELIEQLGPGVSSTYAAIAGADDSVTLTYVAPWRSPLGPGLAAALAEARPTDVRRGVSTVGPHRDDMSIGLRGMPSRTHASQGEQRSLALALRLGGHAIVTTTVGSPPVLLLDDVFSELDPDRSTGLLRCLPPGQAVLTTAGPLPRGLDPAAIVQIKDGGILSEP